MFLRYPDRPTTMHKEAFPYFKDGEWEATMKLDGWQCLLIKDSKREIVSFPPEKGDHFFLSRREKVKGGPTKLPVGPEIIEAVNALNLPDRTFLATEWMERRSDGKYPEMLYIFDLLWLNNTWLGDIPYSDRRSTFRGFVKPEGKLIAIPESVDTEYAAFFEKQKTIPYSEGIVLKKLNHKLKGDTAGGVDNPMVVKIKYRAGNSGHSIVS